jgi:hypothetical protein
MDRLKSRKKGQAILMVSVALFAMCGMLGLAVDLGWSYFTMKSARTAADSAALAAAEQAFQQVGTGLFLCDSGIGGNVRCYPDPVSCAQATPSPPTNNVENGCLYAQQNGFTHLGDNSRQDVTMQANTTSPAPTAPGVVVAYWVTTRVTQSIPQLFSAILGNKTGLVAARATAGVLDAPVLFSIYTLDRQNDSTPNGNGIDLFMNGGGTLQAQNGIMMASTANGTSGHYVAQIGGSAQVLSSTVDIRGAGWPDYPSKFNPPPTNGFPDGTNFMDPMKGKGQPPPPPRTAAGGPPEVQAPSTGYSGTVTLTPGRYYAVDNQGRPTGNPIQFNGNITFSPGPSGFGEYVFYGGVAFNNPGSVITFGAGRYVVAGAKSNKSLVNVTNAVVLQDNSTAGMPASDAGEIFIFTDTNYPGLEVPAAVQALNLGFSSVDFQMGNDTQGAVNLHGLNNSSSALPANLKQFAPVVFWQDQRNSLVKYKSDGNIDYTSCGAGHSIDNPCTNSYTVDPNLTIQASPNFHMYGVIYQPRGGYLSLQGSGNNNNPLMLVTGSLNFGGTPTTLQPLPTPLGIRRVSLVE